MATLNFTPWLADNLHLLPVLLGMELELISTADTVIAATALSHDGQLATRNTSAFDAIGLKLINPWDLDGGQT